VQIEMKAVKPTLLVGEPLALAVAVRTETPIHLGRDLGSPSATLKVLVQRGPAFAAYQGEPWASGWREDDGAREVMRTEYVLSYDTGLSNWVFPAPGAYRLVAQYHDRDTGLFRSNVVTVDVDAPTGDEKAVHDALRRMGPQLIAVHRPHRLSALRPLVQRFPRSVYLQEARLNDLNAQIAQAAHSPAQLAALVPEVEAAARVPGPFQPDALLVLAALHDEIGHKPVARSVYERIAREFPDREAARLARRETRQ
jgi:hypothetical protein